MDMFLTIDQVVNLQGITKQAVSKALSNGKYANTRQVKAENGGGKNGLRYEIALHSLPEKAQEIYRNSLFNQQMESISALQNTGNISPGRPVKNAEPLANLPAERSDTDYFAGTEEQRRIDLAIQGIFRFIDSFNGSESAAVRHINSGYAAGNLPSTLVAALDNAKEKNRKNAPVLARSTLISWKQRKATTGTYSPKKKQADMAIKPWYEAAIAVYATPQKRCYTAVVRALKPHYPELDYWQVYHFFTKKFSRMEVLKGRHKGQALWGKQFYKRRTTDGVEPGDEAHGDGQRSHCSAPHPVTGEYVTFEVWDFHDIATRYVPPLAIGLSETPEVIAKGIENLTRELGVFSTIQVDSTNKVKGNTTFCGDPVVSICDLLGTTIKHPVRVGSAQTNGITEHWHSWIDRESRELTTYQGKKMDSLTFRNVQKLTAKRVQAKAAGDLEEQGQIDRQLARIAPGILFDSTQAMYDWYETKRVYWNNRPHSSLKKIKDPVTGLTRHQTPQECLDEFKANGWEPVAVDEAQLMDLFRPRVRLKVRRGIVKPYGGKNGPRFRHKDLDHWEGLEVIVAFDIMDSRQVWVSNEKGALICVAGFVADVAFTGQTAKDMADEKRARAQIKRLDKKADVVRLRAGLNESPVIEGDSRRVIEFSEPDVVLTPKISLDAVFVSEVNEENAPIKMSLQESDLFLWGTINDEDEEKIEKQEIKYD